MNHAHSEHEIVGVFGQLGVHMDSLTDVPVGQHSWEWGIDITWGTLLCGPFPAVPNLTYEKVDDDFEYGVGMMVAIAAYLEEETSQAENGGLSDGTVIDPELAYAYAYPSQPKISFLGQYAPKGP
jgi:hypothetical protein